MPWPESSEKDLRTYPSIAGGPQRARGAGIRPGSLLHEPPVLLETARIKAPLGQREFAFEARQLLGAGERHTSPVERLCEVGV